MTTQSPPHGLVAPLLAVRGVSKGFNGNPAVIEVDFSLLRGEVHALMGENGAGKSTLMKILAGIHQPDQGQIEIDGRQVKISTPGDAQRLGVNIIHQELNLMNDLSAGVNLFIGREPRRALGLLIDDVALNQAATQLFTRLNLKLDPRTPVAELSVAQQQMVEIAKALSFEPRILIMDEPTAALNDAEVAELFRVIRQLKSQGVGIVYISHKMDEIAQIADRVTVLRDGRRIATRSMNETSTDEIIRLMVGRPLEHGVTTPPDTRGNEVVLEVRGLSRGKAVRDVSFQLRRGEILGMAGLMGAGRTEMARLIFGADKRDAGEILVNGRVARINTPADAVKQGIGYLSEDRKHFGLAVDMDIEANIAMAALADFVNGALMLRKSALRETADRYLTQLQIKAGSASHVVRQLSGGNQQKVVIAKWLLRDCAVLIFDEPTRGIDVGAKVEIYKLLEELAKAGKAIIVISSEMPEVLRLSHRVLVMCQGRLAGELPIAEATQERIMHLAAHKETVVA
ncbi:MAG TPA: sugar ABC transporter ATP-binding protein [Burkholderiaceae bacterium]